MQYQFALDTCIENGFNSNYRGPEIAKKFQDSPTKTQFCICVITRICCSLAGFIVRISQSIAEQTVSGHAENITIAVCWSD